MKRTAIVLIKVEDTNFPVVALSQAESEEKLEGEIEHPTYPLTLLQKYGGYTYVTAFQSELDFVIIGAHPIDAECAPTCIENLIRLSDEFLVEAQE